MLLDRIPSQSLPALRALRKPARLIGVAVLLGATGISCSLFTGQGPPRDATIVNVTVNQGAAPWLREASEAFNAARFEDADGDPIYVELTTSEAGQAVAGMTEGAPPPHVWIPDAPVWAELLADRGAADFGADCRPTAESPLVIAMWRPIAESLGWPSRELGWLDIASLAADPSAWEYYSGGQFGAEFRLGHTHPGLSATGTGTLLALVQAANAKSDPVATHEIDEPIVQASVGSFEGAVSWFSVGTEELGQTLSERGVGFLSAAVIYESTLLEFGFDETGPVPIYPFEGTFVATHPACLRGGLDEVSKGAAARFRNYLLSEDGQRLAVAHGLRPVSPAVDAGPPLDLEHGVDLSKPEVVFEWPAAEAIYAVQALWQAQRKPLNLVMLIDVSGSMSGDKIESVKVAAADFVRQMGDDDRLTLIAFSQSPQLLTHHTLLSDGREQAIGLIASLDAVGDTTLYDAIGDGAAVLAATNSPEYSNAMIVLTDGMDTASTRFEYGADLASRASANSTTVFTIAYGDDADEDLLSELARLAHGQFFQGDQANIAAIYETMSAAFGGTAGIGR